MASRKNSRRLAPVAEAQAEPLTSRSGEPPRSSKSAPRTAREWEVFRMGVREGIVRAQQDAEEKADQFLLRFDCNGVELSTPSAADAERHGADAERSRIKTPAGFTPQLKRRGA